MTAKITFEHGKFECKHQHFHAENYKFMIIMDNRSPLKEAVNPRPSRLMKPGSLLKPPTQVSHLPKPASASQLPKAPSASQLKRKAEPVEQPAAKKTRVVAPLRKPASNGVTSTAPRSCTQRPGMANRSAASRPTAAGAVASRPIASRAPAVRPAVGAAKPRVGGVTRPGVTAKTNAVKRPSDGQVKKLEAENEDLQEQLQRMQRSKEKAETEVEDLEALLRKAKRNLEEVEEDYERQLKKERLQREELEDRERRWKGKVERLEEELEEKRAAMAQLRETINRLEKQVSDLRADTKELNAQMEDLSGKLHAKEATIQDLRSTLQDRDSSIADLENTVAENKATILDLEAKLREGERMRKVLHNTVLELKGNIRVFCRVRPLLGEELAGVPGDDPDPQHIVFGHDGKSLELEKLSDVSANESILSQTIRGPLGKGKYSFHFDQVFSPSSTQSVVFEEISQLVQSALDGYQVAIFAYGQTGSGKTFTMEGVQEDLEQRGMIPRSVEQVFASAEHLRQDGWKYELQVSFLEIYNEKIRDLLTNSKDQEVKHELKMVSPNSPEVMVTNLTYVKVNSPQQVFGLLKKASTNRAVAETKMNEHSSRSHSVFRLHLKGFNSVTHEKSAGCLNMIDLAGSERLKESKSEGERLKETKNINSSLANLGNVIMALANKDQHVPYRNSKLTHLLSNSLGGSSKVLMLLNLNPREECFSETLNSLRFATKVNNCNIGTAQKKTK